MRNTIRAVVVGVAAVLLLGGCVQATPTPNHTAAAPSATPSASPMPSTPASPPPTAAGCKSNSTKAPAGAVTAPTIDVDGDGRADEQWIAQVGSATEFGVTTSSGATFFYSVNSASPIARGGFVARISPTRVISLLSDGRRAYLHTLENCAFVQPTNIQGNPYGFDLQNLTGNGTGVGCAANASGALDVVGYKEYVNGGLRTVVETRIVLNDAGTEVTNGSVTTVARNVSSSSAIAVAGRSVTCGSVSVSSGGVALTQ